MADKSMVIKVILDRWQDLVPVIHIADSDAVTQILRRKITDFVPELSQLTPDHLLLFCSACSCGNPGMAQVLLKNILMENKETCIKCLRNGEFLPVSIINTSLIDNKFPIMDTKVAKDIYLKKWDEQKISDGNACDKAYYWEEIIH